MRERALLVGGRLTIDSDPERGSQVKLEVPGGEDTCVTVPLKTRILLADDHEVVRSGLRMVLDAVPDLEVVAEAGDGAEAVKTALAERVDLAVLDVSMPRMTGLQAAVELRRREPKMRVLMLSMHDNERYSSRHSKREPPATSSKRRRSGPHRGLPGRDARRAIPLSRRRSPR